jgi:ribosomal protein S18 acetylase RimI-like enzyme
MGDFLIRGMRSEDIESVVAIQEKLLNKKVAKKWRQALDHYLEKDRDACLIAEHDKKVLGFIIGDIKYWGFGLRQSGWIEIIGIHPKYMGSGVGHELGNHLIQYFKSRKVDGIYTAVRWDSGDLLSFFKSIGFEHSGFLNLEYKK